jgi:hypothetical protein
MFSFENNPGIYTISSASEFLGDTINIWDNDSALVYCICRRTVAARCLHYVVKGFFRIFIKDQIMSHVLNFVVGVLLVLTKLRILRYDLMHNEYPEEAKALQIEPNATYRKYKGSTHMSLIDHPINNPDGHVSHLDSLYHSRSKKLHLRPV